MSETWEPPLRFSSVGGRCRLSLGGFTHGNGDSLDEAANDLVTRLLNLALCFRSTGFRIPAELGLTDHRWLEFLWELGDLASRGDDIRGRVFGGAGPIS
jgi:hypothetical protein